MNTSRLLNLVVMLTLLVACVMLKGAYENLSGRLQLPELFEHMLYRVMLGFLFVETMKGVIFLFYRTADPSKRKDNFTIGVNHISTVLYGLFFVTLVLALLNISVKEAITTLSLIAAAVVLMTKDYIANLINGMYLTFAKVIAIGDQVMIEGHKGKIMDITLTNVHLLNDDDDMIYLPNNLVFSHEIVNYTRRELKKSSIDFEADPFYIRDVATLESEIIGVLKPFHDEIIPDSYTLKTVSVKRDAISFKFQYVLKDPFNKETDKKIRRFLIREIVRIVCYPALPGMRDSSAKTTPLG